MHLLSHSPQNIEIYGAPLNFDCTNGEHALQVGKNTTIHEFNRCLAKQLQQHQIQLQYITEYSMTNCPFVKVVSYMKRNHISQRDQQLDWCWNNVLLNNNMGIACYFAWFKIQRGQNITISRNTHTGNKSS